MKANQVVNSVIALAPMVSIVSFGILAINILGAINGNSGGLSWGEFKFMFWMAIICLIVPLVYYSIGGIVLKVNPIKLLLDWAQFGLLKFSKIFE